MKMDLKKVFIVGSSVLLLTAAGCCTPCSKEASTAPVIVARYAPSLKVDGRMSDPAWAKAEAYRLTPYNQHAKAAEKTAEAVEKTQWWHEVIGKVLYDDNNIYVGWAVKNDDIRALRPIDQTLLFRYGDTMEVFLKPKDRNSFAELYITPAGNKTSIIFPSRSFQGTALLEVQKVLAGFEVYSSVDGTLNDGSDKDRGWTGVMVIPRKKLAEALGAEDPAKTKWTMLLAGYAYSSNQIYPSNFSYPEIPVMYFLLSEYYAELILAPPAGEREKKQ